MNNRIYELNVEPHFTEALEPIYEATIYFSIPAGISGPYATVTFDTMAQVDAWVKREGFKRTSDFGPINLNGAAGRYATATLERAGA